MMKMIDHQDIVAALEYLISKYSKEIAPYAVTLVEQLVTSYYQYRKNALDKQQNVDTRHKEDDEMGSDDGDSNMAAQACLEAILKIFNSDLPCDTYCNLSPFVINLMNNSI